MAIPVIPNPQANLDIANSSAAIESDTTAAGTSAYAAADAGALLAAFQNSAGVAIPIDPASVDASTIFYGLGVNKNALAGGATSGIFTFYRQPFAFATANILGGTVRVGSLLYASKSGDPAARDYSVTIEVPAQDALVVGTVIALDGANAIIQAANAGLTFQA